MDAHIGRMPKKTDGHAWTRGRLLFFAVRTWAVICCR
jgi:hypothetical protein